MLTVVVLGMVVANVLLSWVPSDINLTIFDLITDVETVDFYQSPSLFLDSAVGSAHGRDIVVQ